ASERRFRYSLPWRRLSGACKLRTDPSRENAIDEGDEASSMSLLNSAVAPFENSGCGSAARRARQIRMKPIGAFSNDVPFQQDSPDPRSTPKFCVPRDRLQ